MDQKLEGGTDNKIHHARPDYSDCFRFDLLPCISLHSGGSSGCIDEGINRYAEWHAGRKCDSSGNRDWCDDRL